MEVGGFSGAFGSAGAHTVSGSNWTATATPCCAQGWDIFYDPTRIEFSPVPRQSLKTTKTCRDLATGALTTTTTTSADFYGAEASQLDLTPSLACPAGSVATAVGVQVCGAAGGGVCTQAYQWVADTRVQNPPPSDPYKECLPGGGLAPCYLKLYKHVTTGWKLCDATSDCHLYDAETADPALWKCEWGPYTVAASQCAPLESWTALTVENGTLDPDGAPTSSPSTGTGTFPESGTNPEAPSVTPGVGTDPDSRSCYGDAWSWNPVDWVVVPVKCVLVWAFVPSSPPGYADVESPIPSGWIPDFADIPEAGCGPITLPSLNLGDLLPATGSRVLVNTCSPPWPLVRSVVYYGTFAVAMVSLGHRAFRAVMNAAGMGVDFVAMADKD